MLLTFDWFGWYDDANAKLVITADVGVEKSIWNNLTNGKGEKICSYKSYFKGWNYGSRYVPHGTNYIF